MNTQPDPSATTKIIVVDDHPLLCQGLSHLIDEQPDLQCCGVAADCRSARNLIERMKPNFMLLDLRLKNEDGLHFLKDIQAENPGLRVLVLSQYDETLYAERTLRAGACGYLMKEEAAEEVLVAIRTILDGQTYVSRRLASGLMRQLVDSSHRSDYQSREGVEGLTDRELQIFQMLGADMAPSAIAKSLHVSPKTVETHRDNIKIKLEIGSAAELRSYAAAWVNGSSDCDGRKPSVKEYKTEVSGAKKG